MIKILFAFVVLTPLVSKAEITEFQDGAWRTVASVTDNYRRWLDLPFEGPVSGDACRVVWTRSWVDGAESRVFSFEVY